MNEKLIQRDLWLEEKAKREALEKLNRSCSDLIATASQIAYRLARKGKTICSEDVWEVLRERAETDLALKSRLEFLQARNGGRWMGRVFKTSEWECIGAINRGSHSRPIRQWKLRGL